MDYNNNTNSERFFQVRNARHTEIAEDYTEIVQSGDLKEAMIQKNGFQ